MAKTLKAFKAKLLADPRVREEYEKLVPEYAVARAIIAARASRGITQHELARRMKTSQSYVARLESGRSLTSMRTVVRVAKALRAHPRIEFVEK